MSNNFEAVWQRIGQCAGQTFATAAGQPFYYDVTEDGIAVQRSTMFFTKSAVEEQFKEPGASGGRGQAAYISAILRDIRIRS